MWSASRQVWTTAAIFTAFLLLSSYVQAQSYSLPVVPGGLGYGMQTRAAYGGNTAPTVYRVTNLNDSGSGSLRAALEATGPRVVVFEISGYIDLSRMIRITSPYITVAGQTAPSPGITVRKFGIEVQTHDVLLQHFRIRPGEWGLGVTDNCALIAWNVDAHDIVLDHMSVSWGPDENIAADTYYSGDMNMTVWRSISAEGLDRPASVDYSESHGFLVMANSRKVYLGESLLSGNRERNPYMQSDTSVGIVNNLVFNWYGPWAFFFSNRMLDGNLGGKPWSASVVGNRLIPGENTDDDRNSPYGFMFYYDFEENLVQGNRIYRSDNTFDNPFGIYVDVEGNELPYNPNVSAPPSTAPLNGVSAMSSSQVENWVTRNAGARPADRDDVDLRIIDDVTNRRSRGYIRSQDEVGGYPALAVNRRTLTLPASPNTVTSSGYTNLEVWLHSYSDAVEGKGQSQTGMPPAAPSAVVVGD